MNKIIKLLCFAFLFTQFLNTAFADITMNSYIKSRHKEYMQFYVVGVVRGFQWANAELVSKGQPPLFCEPRGNILNNKDILPMINALVDDVSKKTTERIEIEDVIRLLLKKVYPC